MNLFQALILIQPPKKTLPTDVKVQNSSHLNEGTKAETKTYFRNSATSNQTRKGTERLKSRTQSQAKTSAIKLLT
jgi:hypothetical protein